MITVVDYDAGNIGSVVNICKKAGGSVRVARNPAEIARAHKLILPGVGHFGRAIERLQQKGLVSALNEAVLQRKVPILGICLGMQLLTQHSEEGDVAGLGWVAGRTLRFRLSEECGLRVPHMGWNRVEIAHEGVLTQSLPENPRFYFVHSYHVRCDLDEDVLMRTTHGETFVSAVHKDNIWGTQFHPEKSHKYGLAMIRNFIERVQ